MLIDNYNNGRSHPKLTPLICDLDDEDFHNFICSTEFDRLCIELHLIITWNSIQKYVENTETLFDLTPGFHQRDKFKAFELMTHDLYGEDPNRFENFIEKTIIRYIGTCDQVGFDDILSDLQVINFNTERLGLIERALNSKNSREQKVQSAFPKETLPKYSKILGLKEKKNLWLDNLSDGKLEDTITAIIQFAKDNNLDKLRLEITGISAQFKLFRTEKDRGTISNEKSNLSNNNHIWQLIKLVSKIEDYLD